MPSDEVSDDSPATRLFPQFESELYRMAASEVAGLAEEQLDFESDKWGWSGWSIRRQLSHMASGNFRWFWQRWGLQLFSDHPPLNPPSPEETVAMTQSQFDRRLDEDLYWGVEVILEKLLEGLALGQLILAIETAGSLRTKEFEFSDDGKWPWFYDIHTGLRRDAEVPTKIWFTLETIFRHRYFEHITHLYNIQRLKMAQGLSTTEDVPIEGYMALPGWDLSTP
jgi:hypothetical protein